MMSWASLISICTGVSSTWCHELVVWFVYELMSLLHDGTG